MCGGSAAISAPPKPNRRSSDTGSRRSHVQCPTRSRSKSDTMIGTVAGPSNAYGAPAEWSMRMAPNTSTVAPAMVAAASVAAAAAGASVSDDPTDPSELRLCGWAGGRARTPPDDSWGRAARAVCNVRRIGDATTRSKLWSEVSISRRSRTACRQPSSVSGASQCVRPDTFSSRTHALPCSSKRWVCSWCARWLPEACASSSARLCVP
mmetsp:Transcript_17971/g.58796  ORF Transcript_17971/g.58796 Transcript_17971/m.58796 type:complete len:208 (+) Transcript_17971:778-1401(+)|eukprot:scaffold13528_cov126-Isochrysis_galbana.AAC.3